MRDWTPLVGAITIANSWCGLPAGVGALGSSVIFLSGSGGRVRPKRAFHNGAYLLLPRLIRKLFGGIMERGDEITW